MAPARSLHLLQTADLRLRLRERLAGTAPGQGGEPWLAGLPPELTASFRHLMPQTPRTAAVLVPIVDHGSELSVLLTQRAADLKHHPGQISFPGGRIEAEDTDALAAALRETREETELGDLVLRWGEEFRETAPYAGGKTARYYVAESPGGDVALPVSEELGRPEHHEYRWVGREEARRLLPARLQAVFVWASAVVEGA